MAAFLTVTLLALILFVLVTISLQLDMVIKRIK